MIRILIVDDEISAGNILRMLIQKHISADKEIAVCNNPMEALAAIEQFKPTLLMLDIEMPVMNGFDLLNQLGYWEFDVIFTTAYDKYAIKAIRFSAMDYLLKPIDIVEMQNAINRHIIKNTYPPVQRQELVSNLLGNLKRADQHSFKLALSTMEGVFFFEPAQIIRLEGESNYTRFFFTDQRPLLVSHTLKEYEELLHEHNFIRVHKSHLVNKACVKHIDKEGMLWLTDGSHIAVSRRKKEEVIKELRDR
jgi:two-component system LytT family response regulator